MQNDKIKKKLRKKKYKFGLTQLTRHQQHEIRIRKIRLSKEIPNKNDQS
jgi:hypothetical protein